MAKASTDNAISLKGVHKGYGTGGGRTPVLKGVSLDIARGEIVALVGQSGSGKSTLLNIIGGLDTADEGHVEVLGIDYDKASDGQLSRLRNQKIGFVFQAFNLLEHLSVLANVVLPRVVWRRLPRRPRSGGESPWTGLGCRPLQTVDQGSFRAGRNQRVAIARALFNQPDLLLSDEPTGNLDTDTGRDNIEFFAELNQRDGVTLLIVTHEERVSSSARRVIRNTDGLIVSDDHDDASVQADRPGSEEASA